MTEEYRTLQNILERESEIQHALATLTRETYSKAKSAILDNIDLSLFSAKEIIRFSSMRPGKEDIYALLFTDTLRDRNMNATFMKVIKSDYSPFARRIVDMSGLILSSIDFKGDKISMLPFADIIPNYYSKKELEENSDLVTRQWVYDGYKIGTIGYSIKIDNVEMLRDMANYGPFDYNQKIPIGKFECYKFSPMSLISTAARFGSLKCFKFLLFNNAIADHETCEMAMSSGHREIIKILDQNELNFEGCINATVFHRYEFIKWLYKKNHVHVVSLSNIESLLKLENIKNKEDILVELVKKERYDIAKYYILSGAKVNVVSDGKTLLQIVSEKGNKEMNKFLILHGALDDGVNETDGVTVTAGQQQVVLKFDPKLFGIDELDDDIDNPLLEKAKRVGKLTYELEKNENLIDLPNDKKEWLHRFYGANSDIRINFNYQNVPIQENFNTEVEQEFQKQVSKGYVKLEGVDQTELDVAKIKLQQQAEQREKEKEREKEEMPRNLMFTWLPLSEINTAKIRIDTLNNVSNAKKKEIRKLFAIQVINVISQFDAIGNVSDDKITVEQAALLRQTFSDALYEIQKELFKPYGKKFENERRVPLTGYGTLKSGDRYIKPARDKPLDVIAEEIFNSTGKRETTGPDLGTFAGNLEEVKTLPPEYRPVPNSSIKMRFDTDAWNNAVEKAKNEILKSRPRSEAKPEQRKPRPGQKGRTVILTNFMPKPVPAAPPKPADVIRKTKKKQLEKKAEKKPIPYEKFKSGESKVVDETNIPLEIEKSQEPEIPDYNKMFTTRPPDEVFQITAPKESKALPKKVFVKPQVEEGRYSFKPKRDDIQKVLEGAELFDNNEKPLEHDQLTKLWDRLDIHPDSRLLMASRLCKIMIDDSMSDYHFRTIVSATKQLDEYFTLYKQIKTSLLYDPANFSSDQRAELDKLIREYTIVAGTLAQTNKELTHILGTSLQTARKGTIEEIIAKKNAKLRAIAQGQKIDIGSLGA